MPNRNNFLIAALICMTAAGDMAQADWKSWLDSARETVGQPDSSGSRAMLSDDQVVRGLKEALRVGTGKAIAILGHQGGYLNDSQVRIPLPENLQSIAKGLRSMGQDKLVDEFVGTLNRAAERAVPETMQVFSDTIREMSLKDARGILNGGDSAATDYFRRKGSGRLDAAILPIVQQATREAGVTSAYKDLLGKVGFLGDYVDMDALDLDRYVTARALDGLFLKLAEQERLIRQDPVARTSDILKTVFGSMER